MDANLRNTPGLTGEIQHDFFWAFANYTCTAKIERLRDDLIKHFEALVGYAGVCSSVDLGLGPC